MRALALCIAALVAADVCAEPRQREEDRRPALPPAFSLLPGGTGAGVSRIQTNLDQLFASEMVGSWFSLRGDGTTAGPLAIAAVGAPSSQSDRLCPNGPDCAGVAGRRLTATAFYATAGVSAPSGDFSICVFGRLDGAGVFVTKDDGASNRFGFSLLSTDREYAYVQSATGLNDLTANSGAAPSSAVAFRCVTYDFIADGTSVSTIYTNGVANGTSSTQKGPLTAGASVPWRIGANSTGTGTPQVVFGALMTEKVLSASTIAAMATAVLPALQGTRGEAITTTRATVRSCCNGAGCELLPTNRACVQGGTLDVWGPVTNLWQNSENLNSATWGSEALGGVAAPTMTYDSGLTSNGTMTADRADFPATNAGQSSIRYGTSVVNIGAGQSVGLRIRGVSASGSLDFCVQLSGVWSCQACAFSPSVDTLCKRENVSPTSVNVIIGNATFYNGGTTRPAASIYIWGAQSQAATQLGPYCPTTTASATCNADVVSVPTTSWPTSRGAVALTLTPSVTTYGANFFRPLDSSGGGSNGIILYGSGTSLTFRTWSDGAHITEITGTLALLAGTPTRIRAVWGDGNTWLYQDGALKASNITGTANMPSGHAATATVGNNTAGTQPVNGTITDFCVAANTRGCQ